MRIIHACYITLIYFRMKPQRTYNELVFLLRAIRLTMRVGWYRETQEKVCKLKLKSNQF